MDSAISRLTLQLSGFTIPRLEERAGQRCLRPARGPAWRRSGIFLRVLPSSGLWKSDAQPSRSPFFTPTLSASLPLALILIENEAWNLTTLFLVHFKALLKTSLFLVL